MRLLELTQLIFKLLDLLVVLVVSTALGLCLQQLFVELLIHIIHFLLHFDEGLFSLLQFLFNLQPLLFNLLSCFDLLAYLLFFLEEVLFVFFHQNGDLLLEFVDLLLFLSLVVVNFLDLLLVVLALNCQGLGFDCELLDLVLSVEVLLL